MAVFWQNPTSQPAPPKVPLSPLALALLLRLRAAAAPTDSEQDTLVDADIRRDRAA